MTGPRSTRPAVASKKGGGKSCSCPHPGGPRGGSLPTWDQLPGTGEPAREAGRKLSLGSQRVKAALEPSASGRPRAHLWQRLPPARRERLRNHPGREGASAAQQSARWRPHRPPRPPGEEEGDATRTRQEKLPRRGGGGDARIVSLQWEEAPGGRKNHPASSAPPGPLSPSPQNAHSLALRVPGAQNLALDPDAAVNGIKTRGGGMSTIGLTEQHSLGRRSPLPAWPRSQLFLPLLDRHPCAAAGPSRTAGHPGGPRTRSLDSPWIASRRSSLVGCLSTGAPPCGGFRPALPAARLT